MRSIKEWLYLVKWSGIKEMALAGAQSETPYTHSFHDKVKSNFKCLGSEVPS